MGCCFYELLRIPSERMGGPSSQVNRILLPGECCYPLSPLDKKDSENSIFNDVD